MKEAHYRKPFSEWMNSTRKSNNFCHIERNYLRMQMIWPTNRFKIVNFTCSNWFSLLSLSIRSVRLLFIGVVMLRHSLFCVRSICINWYHRIECDCCKKNAIVVNILYCNPNASDKVISATTSKSQWWSMYVLEGLRIVRRDVWVCGLNIISISTNPTLCWFILWMWISTSTFCIFALQVTRQIDRIFEILVAFSFSLCLTHSRILPNVIDSVYICKREHVWNFADFEQTVNKNE